MRRPIAWTLAATLVAATASAGQPWRNYGRDAQHSALGGRSAQPLEAIHWQAPVDLDPQYRASGALLVHYGSPLVTPRNTVVFPVKTGATGGFRVDARNGATGAPLWSFGTDYVAPDQGWTPPCGACLGAGDRVVVPASGGTVLVRATPDKVGAPPNGIQPTRMAFYGIANYLDSAQQADFDAKVKICSPIVSDARGTLYFTFVADSGAPLGLENGIARLPMKGPGSWIKASDAAGDESIFAPAFNAAPALSRDGRTLYVVVRGGLNGGYICALDARTLAKKAAFGLRDPMRPLEPSDVNEHSTASPTVGPDGDVYFGVLESASSQNFRRGWLLHFDKRLSSSKTPGSFGWDDTASVVPRSAVPSYKGRSRYLLLVKYNDYAQVAGGLGVNRLAVLDPTTAVVDPRTGVAVMKEVLAVVAPTPDLELRDASHPDAVREWCINTGAVDPRTKCAIVNNEDGIVYRWDFRTNTLSQAVVLTTGIGEAYTPTVIGPDGTAYAINDATLFAVGKKPK